MAKEKDGRRCGLCGAALPPDGMAALPPDGMAAYCDSCSALRGALKAKKGTPVQRVVPGGGGDRRDGTPGGNRRDECRMCGKIIEQIPKRKPKSYCSDGCRRKAIREQQRESRRRTRERVREMAGEGAVRAVSRPMAAIQAAGKGNAPVPVSRLPAKLLNLGQMSEAGKKAGLGSILDSAMESLLAEKMRLSFSGSPAEAREWLADRLDALRGCKEVTITITEGGQDDDGDD